MKKTCALLLISAVLLLLPLSACSNNTQNVVNVYNWGEYIDTSIFDDFQAKTGIKVNYQLYESNESLYATLRSGGSNYDVIIPSDYMISRLIQEDRLEKIDFANIPNISKIDPNFLSREYDPNNEYSVPYMWGTVGIIYDPNIITTEVNSWSVLFDPQYSGQILMFDNSRDAMGIALLYLGYSINTTDENELNQAYELLKQQKPLLQAYVMDQIFDKLEGGEAAIGPYYAGDYGIMLENNPDLLFCLPDEGSNVFIDAMCIPKGAQNKKNAELFINFMCETDIALKNAEATGYSTPSREAFEQLPDDIRYDTIVYPPADVLARCESFINLPQDTLDFYDRIWAGLKAS